MIILNNPNEPDKNLVLPGIKEITTPEALK